MVERRNYYWIKCVDPETGKPYLIWGGNDENSARSRGIEMLAGIDFKIVPLKTRNLSMASSMIHGKRLEQTHSLRKASRRIGHDKSVKRLIRKRSRGNF